MLMAIRRVGQPGGQPRHGAFLQRLLDLEVVGRHFLPGAAVDDDRLGGAEALGGAGDVDRGDLQGVELLHRKSPANGFEELRGRLRLTHYSLLARTRIGKLPDPAEPDFDTC
jgi:hypothetical protein